MEPLKRVCPAVGVTPPVIQAFRRRLYRFFHDQGRQLPWRATRDPYHILVSEIMLQQTQVERIIQKYAPFIAAFPDFPALARASLGEIMARWQGLGYNRRSACYQRQAPFADSDRQIRGLVLKTILARPGLTVEELVQAVGKNPRRTLGLIHTFRQEGFLEPAAAGPDIAFNAAHAEWGDSGIG